MLITDATKSWEVVLLVERPLMVDLYVDSIFSFFAMYSRFINLLQNGCLPH